MSRFVYKKHLQPALYAVLIGSVIGSYRVLPVLAMTGYLKYHLYYTSLRMLMVEVNELALLAGLALYALHTGRLVKKPLRIPCYVLAGIGFVRILEISVDWKMLVHTVFRGVKFGSMMQEFIGEGMPQIIASIICLVAALVVLRQLRKHRSEDAPVSSPSENPAPSETTKVWTAVVAGGLTLITASVAVLFLAANAAWGILLVKNGYDNHSRPNVIYIMVDTLRADHLGCYGYARNTSPNIDEFAGASTRFSKAISQAPWTTASISSFMSGRYLRIVMNSSHGVRPLGGDIALMPELLRDRGYETAAVISNPLAGKMVNLNRGYDRYYEMGSGIMSTFDGKQLIPPTVFSKSMSMIRQMKGKRFFLFAHFMGPHDPYAAHKEYNFYPEYKGKLSSKGVALSGGRLAGDDLKYAVAMYDGEIAYTDHYIGMFLNELKNQGLYDNSLIVVLADHGEELNDHGEMTHGKHLFDDTISVPLIIKLPNQKQGSVVENDWSLVNLLPSVAEYIGCGSKALEFDGIPVRLDGLRRVRQSHIYSSTDTGTLHLESLRSGNRKLIVEVNSKETELYDLLKDPSESRNIAAHDAASRDLLMSGLSSLDRSIDSKLSSTMSRDVPLGDENANKKTLRALGYLQ